MTKEDFIKKWAWKYVYFSRTLEFVKEEFEKDLNEMLSDRSTEAYSPEGKETSVYIPEKEEEEEPTEKVYVGRWFNVIDHT